MSIYCLQSHPTAKGLRNKPFRYYDELSVVFGKDRANGHGARGLGDMIDDIDIEVLNGETNLVEEENDNEQEPEDDTQTNTPSPPVQKDKKRKRKSKSEDSLVETLTETISKFSDMYALSTDNMSKIANCFQNEAESHTRRMNVFAELKKIDGLTQEQVLRAGQILVESHDKTNFFYTLDDEYKLGYILMLLG